MISLMLIWRGRGGGALLQYRFYLLHGKNNDLFGSLVRYSQLPLRLTRSGPALTARLREVCLGGR